MSIPGFRLIEMASRLVPPKRREGWRKEWEAEVAYAWRRMEATGQASAVGRLRLRVRALSSWIDAIMELKEDWRMTGLLNDLRHAVRGLVRYPAFTLVAVVTLALGIGANTAVFTLVDGVLIRPLPFPAPEELISVEHLGREGQDQLPISEGLYLLYKDQAGSLEGIALLLGLIGIYGVISYVVSQRTREIGVRMALGATAPSVRGMVVRQGLSLAGAGIGLGLLAAGLLSSVISSLLFGVNALDPLTYGTVAAALVGTAAFASWLPARRAAGVDPSRALRED